MSNLKDKRREALELKKIKNSCIILLNTKFEELKAEIEKAQKKQFKEHIDSIVNEPVNVENIDFGSLAKSIIQKPRSLGPTVTNTTQEVINMFLSGEIPEWLKCNPEINITSVDKNNGYNVIIKKING